LGEIDNVDAIAATVDEAFHLRVPAMGLMAEMHARFEKLAHGEFWHCHGNFLFRLIRRERL
jgi:hypothetical protein